MNVRCIRGILLGMALLFPAAFAAGAAASDESPFELPKYTVTDQLQLPKRESWLYTRIPGFEILSGNSPTNTRRFLDDFQRLQQVIDIVWPPLRQGTTQVPGIMVLYGGGQPPDLVESGLTASGEDLIEFHPLERAAGRIAGRFTGNGEAICIAVELNRPDAMEQFFRAYIRHLLSRLETPMAPWLQEGLARLFAGVDTSANVIKFAGINPDEMDGFMTRLSRTAPRPPPEAWAQLENVRGGGNSQGSLLPHATGGMRSFPSLAEMLAADEAGMRKGDLAYLAHAFVHMSLYGRGQRLQKPFMLYVARTNGGNGSEETFRDCFGISVKEMEAEIQGYASFTDYRTITFRGDNGQPMISTPPKTELREASQAEIGRIKGEALILSGRQDVARLSLLAPYVRGEHDADLLASLGLYELQAGRQPQARKLLELAARGGTKRARAYLELVRLRQADAAAAAPDQPAAPAEAIAGLLRIAASLEPPLIEVYEMLAAEWLRSSARPPAADLDLLAKGAVRFQRKLKLVYDTARLHAIAGQAKRAAQFADWGARHAPTPRDRERFAQLLATLPAPPPAKQ